MQLPDFKRYKTNTLISRLQENKPLIQVVPGPRQTGKSTAVLKVCREWQCWADYVQYAEVSGQSQAHRGHAHRRGDRRQ